MGTAAVLVAALFGALFLLPPVFFAALLAVVLLFAGLEWAALCRLSRWSARLYALALAIVFLVCQAIGLQAAVFAVAALFWVAAVPAWLWRGVRAGQRTWIGASGFAVLVPAALAMLALEPLDVLLVLVLVWIADSGAYFVGRAWGRHKLAPAISPGKTVEGAAGGLVGALAYAIIVGFSIPAVAWAPFLASAAALFMISIVGDLFESAVKRQAGAKDSGAILPGHGGLLDRIDSTTAALPFAALLWPVVRAAA